MSKFITVIFLMMATSYASAGTAPPGNIKISIERTEIDFRPVRTNLYQAIDTVALRFYSGDLEVSGINLKMALAEGPLTISEILPGEFIDSCRWEYFEVRQVPGEPDDSLSIWQITAVSELIPDSTRPICYRIGDTTTLARIVIQGNTSATPIDAEQIWFYWESCADNSISDKSGNKLFVSDQILNRPQQIVTDSTLFPTFGGVPASCIDDRNPNRPLRRLIFENGILIPKLVIEEPRSEDSTEN